MNAIAALHPVPTFGKNVFGAERFFAATGIFLALSLLVTIPAITLDTRIFQGESIWVKPVKFQIALAIYLLTLAFFARWLPRGMTARTSYRIYSAAVVGAIIAEMLWIGGAAMFGTASHFNLGDPLMAALYPLMGFLAVLLTSATMVYAAAIWRNEQTGLSPHLKLSIVLGLFLTFLLTVPIAGTMAGQISHFVGTPTNDLRVPIFGWSREVGDLRIAHFLATHAMHFLPIGGLVAGFAAHEQKRVRLVWLMAAAVVAATLFTFIQALQGLPLIPVF